MLTQEHTFNINGKTLKHQHLVIYVSGLFQGSQLIWVTLTKEDYAIYMAVKKVILLFRLCCNYHTNDHLPLKRSLEKAKLDAKVYKRDFELSDFNIRFKFIKGIKNTLADTRLMIVN